MRVLNILRILFLFLLGLFLLPRLQFNLGDTQFIWKGIDFELGGVQSPLANFSKGNDVYPQLVVLMTTDSPPDLVFSESNKLEKRLQAIGLGEVRMKFIETKAELQLSLAFPEYYTQADAEVLASILTARGVVDFWKDAGSAAEADPELESFILSQIAPEYKQQSAGLTRDHISGVSLETRSNLQSGDGSTFQATVLRLKLTAAGSDIATGIFADATAAGAGPILMVVDGEPIAVGQPSTANDEMLIVPIFGGSQAEVRALAAYIMQPALDTTWRTNGTTVEEANYAPGGPVVLAAALTLGFILLMIMGYVRYRGLLGREWLINISTYFLLGMSVLKLSAAGISLGLVLGIMLMLIIGVICLDYLLQSSKADFKLRLMRIRNYAVTGFIAGWIFYMSGQLFDIYLELVAVFAIYMMVLLVLSMTAFKYFIWNVIDSEQ